MTEPYQGYYAAKFAREAKENPKDWMIRPDFGMAHKLIYVGEHDGRCNQASR